MENDNLSFVHNSEIDETTKIYYLCRVTNSRIGVNGVVGNCSFINNAILGDFTQINRNCMLQSVEMGDYSYCGDNCTMLHCKVGKYCSISWNVSIGGANHDYKRLTTHSFLYNPSFKMIALPFYNRFDNSCIVGNDVWIGSSAQILRGITIGDGAVIGAGTVVTKDVPPYTIVCGNPGKIIKKRFSDKIIEQLLELKWWDISPELIKENINLFAEEPTEQSIMKIWSLKNNHYANK